MAFINTIPVDQAAGDVQAMYTQSQRRPRLCVQL